MIKQNLHTHSLYDDGKDSILDMVQTAKEKGFTILGFSGHAFNPIDTCSMSPSKTKKYQEQVKAFKEKNREEGLKIYLGIEEDSLTPVDSSLYDYVIGSVHFLEKNGVFYPIDYSKEKFEHMAQEGWNNDFIALAQDYYQAIEKQANNPRIDIVGHIDLITKYNENEEYFSFDDPQILEYATKAIHKLVASGKIFEMNTGAIARGYRQTPYPAFPLLKIIHQANGKVLINTDCHNRENLDLGMQTCLDLAKEAGFKTLYMFDGQNFIERPIEEFSA